jgi:hypothetical protein
VDGGLQSLVITAKSGKDVHCEVVDGGMMKSRYTHCHLLIRETGVLAKHLGRFLASFLDSPFHSA